MTPNDDVSTFRRLCRELGTPGASAWNQQKRADAFERLQAIHDEQRRALLDETWQVEETRRRRRQQSERRIRLVFTVAFLFVFVALAVASWGFHIKGADALFHIAFCASMLFNVTFFTHFTKASNEQRGMARLLLRGEVTPRDMGRLVEVSEFPPKNVEEHEEITLDVMRHLTRLLPTLTQTDVVLLDAHHKAALRRWVARFEDFIKRKNVPMLDTFSTDFMAACLVALRETGGWQVNDREAEAARKAIQKLANAPAKDDEPVNHRYLRDVARESLQQVRVGQTR